MVERIYNRIDRIVEEREWNMDELRSAEKDRFMRYKAIYYHLISQRKEGREIKKRIQKNQNIKKKNQNQNLPRKKTKK
jgi:hypothetical protein